MALINCPECGKEISDKAERCPGCGKDLKELLRVNADKPSALCEECGAEISEGSSTCPNCGCPVPSSSSDVAPQKVEITGVNLPKAKKSTKKVIIAIAIVLALAVIGTITGIQIHNKKLAEQAKLVEQAQLEKEEYEASLVTYQGNLTLASYSMLLGAAKAEECCSLIHDVWYNTIFEVDSKSTNYYTKQVVNGKWYNTLYNEDFNTSLERLFDDSDFQDKLSTIKENQDEVSKLMKALINPPEEYKEAYETLRKCYDAYLDFTNLALSPSGNLTTYTSKINDADSTFLNCYNALSLYIIDK